jgi:hypothetical protein
MEEILKEMKILKEYISVSLEEMVKTKKCVDNTFSIILLYPLTHPIRMERYKYYSHFVQNLNMIIILTTKILNSLNASLRISDDKTLLIAQISEISSAILRAEQLMQENGVMFP